MRMSYYDYVGYMLHEYFAPEKSNRLITPVYTTNKECVRKVLCERTELGYEILRDVFSEPEETPLPSAIRKCAMEREMDERQIWSIVRAATKEIARARGLID